MTQAAEWEVKNAEGIQLGAVTARLHMEFDANAIFVSYFVPSEAAGTETRILEAIDSVLAFRHNLSVMSGFAGSMVASEDMVFTGRAYIYSEVPVPADIRSRLEAHYREKARFLTFRSTEYAEGRMRAEVPLAFISHDSRDKAAIASPLAMELSRLMTPVWYDEYSLSVGDSLRGSIERGIRECKKCILVLTPNFLANGGWSKREYDSIFTRELVEGSSIILPIWHGVSVKDVFSYSPVLADKFAVQWSDGVEQVARKLHFAIERP